MPLQGSASCVPLSGLPPKIALLGSFEALEVPLRAGPALRGTSWETDISLQGPWAVPTEIQGGDPVVAAILPLAV